MQLYAFSWWSKGNSGFFREKNVLLSGVFISMDSAHRCTLVPYSTLPFLAWSLFALNLIWSGRKKPMFIHWKRQTHFCWMNEWGNTFPLTSISDSSAWAIEGFLDLCDEKLVRDGFHGFSLKTKSFASAIGAVSIEVRSFGNLDCLQSYLRKKTLNTNQKNQIL